MPVFRSFIFAAVLGALAAASDLAAAQPAMSRCLAVAQGLAPLVPVAYRRFALAASEVRLTYVGHSTFLIESPQGVRVATDYAGNAGGIIPDVVTMNHAHESHFTDLPDPRIAHVLRGWNPQGGHAEHHFTLRDVFIRNVPTNIRTWSGGTEEFGNSVFIFEVAGLCIGHLGHLHHELTNQQLGQIGQLDVVLVPVDGSYTLDLDGMIAVLKELRARLVIPMHYFGSWSLGRFVERMRQEWPVRINAAPSIILSQATLPQDAEILILPGY